MTETRTCQNCLNGFEVPPFAYAAKFVTICPDCAERQAERDQRETALKAHEAKKPKVKKPAEIVQFPTVQRGLALD